MRWEIEVYYAVNKIFVSNFANNDLARELLLL